MNKPNNKKVENIRLLLVEDDEDFCDALSSRLTKRDFEVEMAYTAEEALEKVRDSRVEVVVADIKLPGMDGIEFLARVREFNKDLPVVLITGYASLESAKEAVKLDAADYLLKPLEGIDELLNPVYKATHGYRLLLENKQLADSLQSKIGEMEMAERKFRVLVESAPMGIYYNDFKGKFLYGNKKAEEITGYKREELMGKSFLDLKLLDPGGLVKAGKLLEMNALGKGTGPDEFELSCKGERKAHVEINTKVIDIDGQKVVLGMVEDITERKRTERALKESGSKLRDQKIILEQKNIALKEILEQIEIEKKQIKDDIFANVDKLLLPALKRLKRKATSVDAKYLDILQDNLVELTSSFSRKITEKGLNLTPREIEVCDMIKSGLSSKQISGLLNLSLQTTERHRNNIRNKLGIVNKSVNLATYLQML